MKAANRADAFVIAHDHETTEPIDRVAWAESITRLRAAEESLTPEQRKLLEDNIIRPRYDAAGNFWGYYTKGGGQL